MCEKAARIAELERDIAHLMSDDGAADWKPAFGAREERISQLSAELARLRTESPALSQGEGSEPVGWRETVQILLDLLNPLHGELDRQTYDQKVAENFNAPDDAEYNVNITTRMERDLSQAVCVLEDRSARAASPQDIVACPACNPHRDDCRYCGGTSEVTEERAKDYQVGDAPPLYASPPPLPAGNADPRVREALETRKAIAQRLDEFTCQAQQASVDTNGADRDRSRWTFKEWRCVDVDELIELASKALALPSPQWQPIETAPKDGKPFLAYCVSRAPFADRPTFTYETARWVEGSSPRTGYFASQSGAIPSHWMLLPAPPRASDRSA